MENLIYNYDQSIEFRTWISETIHVLQKYKKEDRRKDFAGLMEKLLPKVKLYINRQLTASLKNKTLPQGKYKVEDLLDELYIQAYDNIQELTANDFNRWLFSKADEILEDIITEEDFNNMFYKNIEDYSKVEWEAMEEVFTRDASGDLVLIEELDGSSYSKQNYTLQDVFIVNTEEDLIEKLSATWTTQEIHRQIESVLIKLPLLIRTIFDLSVNQQFDSNEIAEIKKVTTLETEDILAYAKTIICTYLIKNHLDE